MTKGTDLLTRQNETRHRTGWTEDRRVSAGKWQCPGINRKEKLGPLPALHPGVWEAVLQWGFRQGCVCDSLARVQGWSVEADLCSEGIPDASVRVELPQASNSHPRPRNCTATVTIAAYERWPNFPAPELLCLLLIMTSLQMKLPPLLPLPDKLSSSL